MASPPPVPNSWRHQRTQQQPTQQRSQGGGGQRRNVGGNSGSNGNNAWQNSNQQQMPPVYAEAHVPVRGFNGKEVEDFLSRGTSFYFVYSGMGRASSHVFFFPFPSLFLALFSFCSFTQKGRAILDLGFLSFMSLRLFGIFFQK